MLVDGCGGGRRGGASGNVTILASTSALQRRRGYAPKMSIHTKHLSAVAPAAAKCASRDSTRTLKGFPKAAGEESSNEGNITQDSAEPRKDSPCLIIWRRAGAPWKKRTVGREEHGVLLVLGGRPELVLRDQLGIPPPLTALEGAAPVGVSSAARRRHYDVRDARRRPLRAAPACGPAP